jgi:hypothetical protein
VNAYSRWRTTLPIQAGFMSKIIILSHEISTASRLNHRLGLAKTTDVRSSPRTPVFCIPRYLRFCTANWASHRSFSRKCRPCRSPAVTDIQLFKHFELRLLVNLPSYTDALSFNASARRKDAVSSVVMEIMTQFHRYPNSRKCSFP